MFEDRADDAEADGDGFMGSLFVRWKKHLKGITSHFGMRYTILVQVEGLGHGK